MDTSNAINGAGGLRRRDGWVELANALGLSQYVDGDLMASKSNIACSCQSQSGGACARNPCVAPQARKLAQLNNAERPAI